jgi:hypothetical protein
MVFSVPKSKKSLDQNKFQYEIDGKTFKVKSVKYLTGWEMEALLDGDLSALYNVFGSSDSPAGKAVRGLIVEEFQALLEAWQADSDIDAGESKAS